MSPLHTQIHQKILANCNEVQAWFQKKASGLAFPFYSSFDVRDSGFKIVPVDANLYPAGFNNLCRIDADNAQDIARDYLLEHYGSSLKKIQLLTEEHTQNLFYWQNVSTLSQIIKGAGFDVQLVVPRDLPAPLNVTSKNGDQLQVFGANQVTEKPDLIISNNDFTDGYEEWASKVTQPINPPREMGWHKRRKDRFFQEYNKLATEFAELIGVDPWIFHVHTEVFSGFDVEDESIRQSLYDSAKKVFENLTEDYKERKIDSKPFVFIKNNSGTYGLGVIPVKDPEEILNWTYKNRKKMKAAKGGREINEVIIQEGVPTVVRGQDGQTAEPCLYMIGCQLVGGFLRTHQEKGIDDSLNSPGAVFQKLCVSDLEVKSDKCPMENVYGWVAKLSFLSVAYEAKSLGVEFPGYTSRSCTPNS